jgi:hypothetical protein
LTRPPANPFSTRFTHPGRLPFLFGDDEKETLGSLLARLRATGLRGEIVGPHGSGKTTLLSHLVETLKGDGISPAVFALSDGQRRMPDGWRREVAQASLVIIDGYEQLGRLSRWRLRRCCRRQKLGLLVTAHAPTGLPTLYRTRPSIDVARQVVHELLPPGVPPPSDDELSHLFDMFHGNLREVLFALYDRFE